MDPFGHAGQCNALGLFFHFLCNILRPHPVGLSRISGGTDLDLNLFQFNHKNQQLRKGVRPLPPRPPHEAQELGMR